MEEIGSLGFREAESTQGDWVEAELREMLLGYERVVTTPESACQALGSEHSLPAIKNGKRIASGKEDLLVYLKELEDFAREWGKLRESFRATCARKGIRSFRATCVRKDIRVKGYHFTLTTTKNLYEGPIL